MQGDNYIWCLFLYYCNSGSSELRTLQELIISQYYLLSEVNICNYYIWGMTSVSVIGGFANSNSICMEVAINYRE